MRLIAFLVAMLVGVAGLGYAAFTETGGWSFPWLLYLVLWLPLTSVISLAVVLLLARRLGIQWPVVTGMICGIAVVQCFTLFGGCDNNSRIPLAIMPLVLVALSVSAVLSERGWRFEPLVSLANRHGRWLLATSILTGITGIAAQAIWDVRIKEIDRQAFATTQAEDDLKNRELKGLPRAAWLLNKAFGLSGFSAEQFLKDKRCELQFHGEFRWDDEQQRLVITQQLFHDDVIRERLLPHAEELLRHPLLKPGVRDDLQEGVLTCTPPLDCQMVWTIDVDKVEYEWRVSEKFTHSTGFIGNRLVEEFSKSRQKKNEVGPQK